MKRKRGRRVLIFGKGDLRYGVFDSETCPEIHVMPCFEDGKAIAPHIPHRACHCLPQADDCREFLFIHSHLQ